MVALVLVFGVAATTVGPSSTSNPVMPTLSPPPNQDTPRLGPAPRAPMVRYGAVGAWVSEGTGGGSRCRQAGSRPARWSRVPGIAFTPSTPLPTTMSAEAMYLKLLSWS